MLSTVPFASSACTMPTRSAASAFPGTNGLIAFNSDGSVYVVKPGGGGLRQIAQTGISDGYPGVSFSPDGKLIAFSGLSATDPDIYTVRPDGSGRRPLTFSRGVDADPTWSGDGTRIEIATEEAPVRIATEIKSS